MALEVPGFCKRCGALLEHAKRPQGRPKEFCGDTCRQAFHRAVQLRADLKREAGLNDQQADRLLDVFHVSRRGRTQRLANKRDAGASRSGKESRESG
jgi:hypothetical protein